MKRVKIIQKDQVREFSSENPEHHIALCVGQNVWGFPERWALHRDHGGEYDDADVLEERVVEIDPGHPLIPEKPAVFEGGNLVAEAVPMIPEKPPTMQKQVKLKSEYVIEIEDITAELEQKKINKEALEYLTSTDWLIIREIDSGIVCPEEIRAARQAARERIVK